jgi:hypothetical protein
MDKFFVKFTLSKDLRVSKLGIGLLTEALRWLVRVFVLDLTTLAVAMLMLAVLTVPRIDEDPPDI